MIVFRQFQADHLFLFEWQSTQTLEVETLTLESAFALQRDGVGWTGFDEAGIVGCAGLMPQPYGLAAWAAFSPRLALHARSVVRFVRDKVTGRAERVIAARISLEQPRAARFARAVGFEQESSADDAELWLFKRSPDCLHSPS